MKKSISTIVLLLLLVSGTLFPGCQSAFQKEEADTAEILAADLSKTSPSAGIKATGYKIINADEWETFRAEAEAKIRRNEMLLAELSVLFSKPGKAADTLYVRRITEVNKQNQAFISRLNAYEKSRSDFETFKRDFKTDMEQLEIVLKDLLSISKNNNIKEQ